MQRSDAIGLVVIDEEDHATLLLHRISADDIYQRQEGTLRCADSRLAGWPGLLFKCCSVPPEGVPTVKKRKKTMVDEGKGAALDMAG